jgi:hypothetical protein
LVIVAIPFEWEYACYRTFYVTFDIYVWKVPSNTAFKTKIWFEKSCLDFLIKYEEEGEEETRSGFTGWPKTIMSISNSIRGLWKNWIYLTHVWKNHQSQMQTIRNDYCH